MANNNENIPYGNTGGDFVLSDTEEKKMKVAMGNRIKQAMENINMTQAELAAKVLSLGADGKPQQTTISKWINGARSPNTIQWCTLAHVLNVSLDWLLLGKEKEDTIQDVARSLSKLATVTDMRIKQCTQDEPEMVEDEPIYNGIQITLFPRRDSYYEDESNIVSIYPVLLSKKSIPLGRSLTVEDNRGRLVLDFLRDFAIDLDRYKNTYYSCVNYDVNTLNNRANLLISSLPPLPVYQMPSSLDRNKLVDLYPDPNEMKKYPWYVCGVASGVL